jgi:signal transduction histidine kinase
LTEHADLDIAALAARRLAGTHSWPSPATGAESARCAMSAQSTAVPASLRTAGSNGGSSPVHVSRRNAPVEGSVAPRAFDGGEFFAACVAHELRTPLATQRALLELALADSNPDAANWRAIGEDVLAACRRQERLLEACLTLARSKGGIHRCEPVDLAVITADALRTYDPSGLESVVSLERAWMSGDSDLLERLVANLVSNAIRHNIADGRIEVATRLESGRAVLSVANTGPLIPACEVQDLFRPFQRLNPNPKTFGNGVGLGLTIVQTIADAHGAHVVARSRTGGGLEIHVSCPGLDPKRQVQNSQRN